jgi:hypothetical protein
VWDALLKRPFQSLKADGPFIFERAEVSATATDLPASLGNPRRRLQLTLVRFRLEGIDTGWNVISVSRILPCAIGSDVNAPHPAPSSSGESQSLSPAQPRDSFVTGRVPNEGNGLS